jgi:hypothetical protein
MIQGCPLEKKEVPTNFNIGSLLLTVKHKPALGIPWLHILQMNRWPDSSFLVFFNADRLDWISQTTGWGSGMSPTPLGLKKIPESGGGFGLLQEPESACGLSAALAR